NKKTLERKQRHHSTKKKTKAPLNVEALPRESIKPITYELADGTSSDTRYTEKKKKRHWKEKKDTAQHKKENKGTAQHRSTPQGVHQANHP
ncbi:hypothetical protein L208DRAFT_1457931, partial [Tricholoma matsutake]